MESLIRDLRYAVRVLAKRRGVTVLAALCLAIGIGATTVVFGLVNAVLLRPLDFRDPDQLVVVSNQFLLKGITQNPFSGLEFVDLKQQNEVFSNVAGFIPWYFNLTEGEVAERLVGARVSAELFPMLGVSAQEGRTFSEDEQRERALVVVLSHGLWQRRFEGDPAVIGRKVSLAGRPYTVVGVMPEGFQFLVSTADMWVPLVLNPAIPRDLRGVRAVARMNDGVGASRAQADMDLIAGRFRQDYPELYTEDSGYRIAVSSLHETMVGPVRPQLLALLGAVALVLGIACTNVANLLLAQATTREKEVAIRAAVGAGRGKLVRQLLTESVLLAGLGGILGLFFAYWGLRGIVAAQLGSLPRLDQASIDLRVVFFTLGVSFLTGVLFGLVPALKGARIDLYSILKEGGKTSQSSTKRHPLRSALVVVQIGLAVVVLIGAGLMIRSMRHLQQVDPGFQAENVLTAQLFLSPATYRAPAQRTSFYQRLTAELETMSGTRGAGVVSHVPLGPVDLRGEVVIEGNELPPGAPRPNVGWRAASPSYFETLGIPLLRGRGFSDLDHGEAAGVVIVDADMARRLWPDGEDPIGKRLHLVGSLDGEQWREVVGIVGAIKQRGLSFESDEQLYVPYMQYPLPALAVVVRSTGDPMSALPALREAARRVDPNQPLASIQSAEQLVYQSLSQPRFNRLLFGLFGGTALILAAFGVYGVMAYAVAQRSREMGLRIALGAQPRDVLSLIVGHGMRLTGFGVVFGVVVAFVLTWALGRVLADMLHGVGSTDVVTFVAVPSLLALLALVASIVPARRATRVNPVDTLYRD